MKTPAPRTRSNGPGNGKTWLSSSITVEADQELRRQAKAAGLTRSAYAGLLVTAGLSDPVSITRQRSSGTVIEYPGAAAHHPTPRAAEHPPPK
jgi:hypothetical protein